MKIYISSDFEGTAGVVEWDQVRDGGSRYEYFCSLLLGEVNAAIEGAMAAGATEFLVNDSHGRMTNLLPGSLSGQASYLSGRMKPWYMTEGLDASFDAAFFVSYHGSMGSASTLSHTYFPTAFAEVRLNGHVAGESAINALVTHAFDIPVLLITGDQITAEEFRPFCPSARSAVVKRSIGRFAAESLHPEVACQLIAAEARTAVETHSSGSNFALGAPYCLEISFKTTDYADLAERIAGCRRSGALAAEIKSDDPLEVHRTFISIVWLCRGLVE